MEPTWGVKYKHIPWFICHPDSLTDGGQAGGEISVYIEFIGDRLPTLPILCITMRVSPRVIHIQPLSGLGGVKIIKIPEI